MCSTLEIIVKVLMCITLIVFIIYNVYEIVCAHKYYQQCKKSHQDYLEELINHFKKETEDEDKHS